MIRTVLLSVLSFGVVMATHAQVWRPDKPIEIVVPTTPGGGIDRTARLLQKIIQENALAGVPVSVNNKPGGGGAVSLVYLNQHAGDAHFVAINSPNLIANAKGAGRLKTWLGAGLVATGATPLLDADGAAVVLHADADDEMTDPSGKSGKRILCGVLRLR